MVYLTPEELNEYRIRRAAYDDARAAFMMIEESYNAWVNTVKDKYSLPDKYNIDTRTGELCLKE